MSVHTLLLTGVDFSDDRLSIEGPEAEHAVRVKRVGAGDVVRVLDGRGAVLTCRVETARKRRLEVAVEARSQAPAVRPELTVCSATPKGARLEKMIDQLGQVGVAAWSALETKLGVVDPGDNKLARMERIAVEAAKQAGRAWVMRIDGKTTMERALEHREGEGVVICDASGGRYAPAGAEKIRLLVGPEGGFLPEEIGRAREGGAQVIRLGAHAMRIETAAVVGAAVVLLEETG